MGRKGTMFEKEIASSYLQETMTLKIFKPESFSDVKKHHICIMQDGNDYYQLGRVATLSDKLHDTGEITSTVFVGIHYQDKYDRSKKYHPDGTQQGEYIKFLVYEVVPSLDDILPSDPMEVSRCLMGDSLAGTLALMTAAQYPNTFGKVIMQSPYVNDTVLAAVKDAQNMDAIDIYHTIGLQETNVDTTDGANLDFLVPNRTLNKLIHDKGGHYTYHELDGGHTWKPWQKDLKRALTTMFHE